MLKFLIDDWFPINEVSIESLRERIPGMPYPPHNRFHVWFARRPLTTSRASVLISILNELANQNDVFKLLGIPPNENVVEKFARITRAKAEGRKIVNPFTWKQAYKHVPNTEELSWLHAELKKSWNGKIPTVLDPMAGGGSIPFESMSLGLPTIAGDLNPVAYLILKATVEYPAKFREKLLPSIEKFCKEVHELAKKELMEFFPQDSGERVYAYLWSRTIKCTACNLLIPLSPNWWLLNKKTAKKFIASKIIKPPKGNICSFEIIENPMEKGYDPDAGTDLEKVAICPRCGIATEAEIVQKIAQEGGMGHQLYAVCTKRQSTSKRWKWVFRAPNENELASIRDAEKILSKKIKGWEKLGLVLDEDYSKNSSDLRPLKYGMKKWRDMFSPRQMFTHLIYLEKFLEVKNKWLSKNEKDFAEAIIVYGAIVFDTCVDYNCLLSLWDSTLPKVAHMMSLQAYPFKTSYAEWNQIVDESGYEWALSKITECVQEFLDLIPQNVIVPQIYNSDSTSIPLKDKSIEAIIVDPPYHDNVMYAEMSDFFYIWLKRIIGDLFTDSFKTELTNKIDEAAANPSLYRDTEKPKESGNKHYSAKMQSAFKEMNRVLKDDGILTVMFTHRKVEAWAELTRALMEAGFTFRSSWPVFTEPGQKFGKADKGVLKVTIILSCRKRKSTKLGRWSEVQRELQEEAEKVVKQHAAQGMTGMDLLVSSYGPALGKFADYSSIKDSFGELIGPEQALDIVSEAVNKYNTSDVEGVDFDTLSYINLLKNFPMLTVEEDLARVTTVFGGRKNIQELDAKGGKGMLQKKAGKVTILLSKDRLANGHIDIKKPETLLSIIDVVHAALRIYETQGITAVKDLLVNTGRDASDSGFISVLKVIASFTMNDTVKKLSDEASTSRLLLQALGHEPESVLKKGEKMSHYFDGQTKLS